jgi:hypothetical protein
MSKKKTTKTQEKKLCSIPDNILTSPLKEKKIKEEDRQIVLNALKNIQF